MKAVIIFFGFLSGAIGLMAAPQANAKTLSPEKIEALVVEATGIDYAIRQSAREQLSQLQSESEFLHLLLLHGKNRGEAFVSRIIGDVFAEIGEPAVPFLFRKSVEYEETNDIKISSAGQILTHNIRYDAVPFFVKKLKRGTLSEQKFSAWALSSICRWRNPQVTEPLRTGRFPASPSLKNWDSSCSFAGVITPNGATGKGPCPKLP